MADTSKNKQNLYPIADRPAREMIPVEKLGRLSFGIYDGDPGSLVAPGFYGDEIGGDQVTPPVQTAEYNFGFNLAFTS